MGWEIGCFANDIGKSETYQMQFLGCVSWSPRSWHSSHLVHNQGDNELVVESSKYFQIFQFYSVCMSKENLLVGNKRWGGLPAQPWSDTDSTGQSIFCEIRKNIFLNLDNHDSSDTQIAILHFVVRPVGNTVWRNLENRDGSDTGEERRTDRWSRG